MSSLLFLLLVPGPPGHPRSAARDRLADTIAVCCALAYGAVMVPLDDAIGPGAAIAWQADVTIGVLCAGVLLLRRRRPLRVCLALLPFGAISVMATGPILVALFTVAVRFPPRALLPLGAAHVLTGCVYFVLQRDPSMPVWVDIVMRGLTGLAVIGWGLFMRAYRQLTESLQRQARRLEAEQQLRVEQARLTERASIAREMHDVLAHRLSMISLHSGALEVRVDADPAELAVAARTIRASARDGLQELREVIGALRESDDGRPEPPQPGFADLADLIDRARTAGMRIDFTSRVPLAGPPLVGRTAYRLVQEGLTNAHKHAPGTAVEVLLDRHDERDLRILVSNPLPDAVPTRGDGTGLIGLGERVTLAGGRVEFGPRRGRFRIEAWLPWPR